MLGSNPGSKLTHTFVSCLKLVISSRDLLISETNTQYTGKPLAKYA